MTKLISKELTKKIKEKIPDIESKITKNLSTMKEKLAQFQDYSNEDFQLKLIGSITRDFGEKFNADIGYASSAMKPKKLSHGAIIFRILNDWFSKDGKIWNEGQQKEGKWYLQNENIQKTMLGEINIKQQNIRGGFNFTSKAEEVLQEIIKNELDIMMRKPDQAIKDLMSQLRNSYIETSEVCENHKNKLLFSCFFRI